MSVSGEEDLAGDGLVFSGVLFQLPAELRREQDGPDLPLQADLRPAKPRRLDGDIPHLRDPDAGGADGLHQQAQALPAFRRRGVQELPVFRLGELPALLPESPALDPEELDLAVLPAKEFQKAVEGGEHGVNGGGGAALLDQVVPPPDGGPLVQLPASQPGGEGGCVVEVFADGARGTVLDL